jgi:hypothetical protein
MGGKREDNKILKNGLGSFPLVLSNRKRTRRGHCSGAGRSDRGKWTWDGWVLKRVAGSSRE